MDATISRTRRGEIRGGTLNGGRMCSLLLSIVARFCCVAEIWSCFFVLASVAMQQKPCWALPLMRDTCVNKLIHVFILLYAQLFALENVILFAKKCQVKADGELKNNQDANSQRQNFRHRSTHHMMGELPTYFQSRWAKIQEVIRFLHCSGSSESPVSRYRFQTIFNWYLSLLRQ